MIVHAYMYNVCVRESVHVHVHVHAHAHDDIL